jgi:tetratricopeptide (TPR) repeat protein
MNTPRGAALLAAVLAAALLPSGLPAQGRHPRYLHARGDLRRAVHLMRLPDEPRVMRDMQAASGRVERAIRELDNAAVLDRRNIDDNPPVDSHLGRGSRFREIQRLLGAARADIAGEADNSRASVWRHRAFRDIDEAIDMVRRGGYDKLRDGGAAHAGYLHAVSDLRHARALLWRGDWGAVMHDQRAAVEEIDRAIDEARRAAIDDGKDINAHPPVDARAGWEDRFRQAMELLNSAERDLSREEDNRRAAAWRSASLGHVQRAKEFVGKAMRDSWWRR